MSDTEAAVQAALSQLGKPYKWGATGPDAFDCSGLTQWAFGKAGIQLGRTTYQQVLQGQHITGTPQRGDLVFPDAGHVMIALGGNQGVHAPENGDVVKVSTYWTTPFAIRRMGTNSGASLEPIGAMSQFGAPNAQDVGLGDVFSIGAPLKSVVALFNFLVSNHGWSRMLRIMAGVVLVLLGAFFIGKSYIGISNG